MIKKAITSFNIIMQKDAMNNQEKKHKKLLKKENENE